MGGWLTFAGRGQMDFAIFGLIREERGIFPGILEYGSLGGGRPPRTLFELTPGIYLPHGFCDERVKKVSCPYRGLAIRRIRRAPEPYRLFNPNE